MSTWSDDWEISEYDVGGATASPSSPSYSSPQPSEDDSSILGTTWEKMKLKAEGFVAANVENPDLSNYAQRRYEKQYADWKTEHDKLGGIGQFASDVAAEAPAIAAFASAPWTGGAGIAAGSAMSGFSATGDTLQAQYEEGRPFDFGSAVNAGAQTVGADLMLGGAGNAVGQALARKAAVPGQVGLRAMASQAAPVAADIAIADAGSAAAGQVYQNLASGRSWDDNVGMAAVTGGVAGGAVRGAGKGFNGISEQLGIKFNKGGEDAITKVTSVNRESGIEPNPAIANSYIDAENSVAGIREKISQMDVDDPNLTTEIQALNKISNDKSVESALMELGEVIPKLHLNTKGYDVNFTDFDGNTKNLGTDILGMSQETMDRAIRNTSKVEKTLFQTAEGAKAEGLSPEAFKQKLHDTYNDAFSKARGNLGDNVFDLNAKIKKASRDGTSTEELMTLQDLHDDLVSYGRLLDKSMQAPSKAEDVHARIKHLSNRIRENSIRTGEGANLKGFSGRKGDFDPTRDFLVFKGLHDSALAQDPSYVYGTTDPLSASAAERDFNIINFAGKVGGKVATAIPGMVYKPYRRSKAKASIAEAQRLGETLRRPPTPAARAEAELSAGNAVGAKEASMDALQASGISVPLANKVDTPIVEAPIAPVVDQPMPDMSVEAPVTPVEPFAPTPSADAKAKVAPAPKAVEEAPEPAPEPKKKAKAKSKTTPEKKKRQLSADEVQAAKAKIASMLQDQIQAGNAPRQVEAKSATAPKAKEAVEAPVEAPVVVEAAPKPKAKAKAAKAPKAKEKPVEDTSVADKWEAEEKARFEAEEAAAKPKAKAAKAPKAKEVEPEAKVEQEAPSEAPREPLGRKEPTRTKEETKPVEEPTEPVVETAPEPEAPKEKPYAKLVRGPLEEIVARKVPTGVKDSNRLIAERRKAQRDLKDIHILEQKFADKTPEDVARVLHESGGIESFREAAKANENTLQQQMKSRLMDLEGLRKREAADKTREMKDLLVKKTETSAPKVDETAVAKKAQREFDGEMEARGIHPEDLSQVNAAIDGGMSHKNARVLAQRLNAERKTNLKEEVKDRAEALKDANAVLKNEGKRGQVDEYLKGMNIEGDKDITGMINNVFKHRSDEVKPKEMQNLLNKIDRHLETQLDEYNSLMRAGGKADPRYPEWNDIANRLRSSQSDLKRNRAQVDKSMSKARDTASEAATEHAQLTKEYDKLFDQANTRDANANKVVKQKDELVRDLEDKGFTTEEAEAFTADAFFKRETTPMNEREMQKTINKFVDQKAKDMEVNIDAKVKEVKAKVADADDATLVEMADAVADDIAYSHEMEANTDEIAMMKAISEEMMKRGDKKALRYKTVAEAMLEGVENRTKFPESPELWLPANSLQDIQKSFGSGDSSYAGRLGVALKLSITGNKNGIEGFGTLDKKVIASRIKKMNESQEGKFLTGMDDLIVK